MKALKRINHLDSNTILVGQKIYLKDKESTIEYYITSREIPDCGYHIVKNGETLYRISKMYDLTIIDLMNFNKLSSYTIKVGEKIWLKSTVKKYAKKVQKQKSPVPKKTGISFSKKEGNSLSNRAKA